MNRLLRSSVVFNLIILGVGLLFFLPSLPFDFIRGMDDDWLVINNPGIREFSWRNIKFLFFEDRLDLHYYPLTYVSLSLDYHFFGLNPMAMRLHNVLLHLASSLLLFRILSELLSSRKLAFWIALVFMVQPMQIESVVWVICRRQVLSLFYFMLTWYLYLKYRQTETGTIKRMMLYLFLLVGYSACLLSKAIGIALPFVMLLSAYLIEKPAMVKDFRPVRRLLWLSPFLVIAATSLYLNALADDGNFMRRSFDYTMTQHLIFVFYTLGYYLYKTLVPFRLSAFYPAPPEGAEILPIEYMLLACVGLGLLVGLVWAVKKKHHLWVFLTAGYFVTIAVLTNRLLLFSDVPLLVADRYYYQSAPFIISMFILCAHRNWPKQFNPLMFVLVGTISIGFFNYLSKWQNVNTLMEHMLANYPTKEFFYRSAIANAMQGGDLKVAKTRLQQAKETSDDTYFNNPDHFKFELGMTYLMVNDTSEAKSLLPTFRTDTSIFYEILARSIEGEDFRKVPFERRTGFTSGKQSPEGSR